MTQGTGSIDRMSIFVHFLFVASEQVCSHPSPLEKSRDEMHRKSTAKKGGPNSVIDF